MANRLLAAVAIVLVIAMAYCALSTRQLTGAEIQIPWEGIRLFLSILGFGMVAMPLKGITSDIGDMPVPPVPVVKRPGGPLYERLVRICIRNTAHEGTYYENVSMHDLHLMADGLHYNFKGVDTVNTDWNKDGHPCQNIFFGAWEDYYPVA